MIRWPDEEIGRQLREALDEPEDDACQSGSFAASSPHPTSVRTSATVRSAAATA